MSVVVGKVWRGRATRLVMALAILCLAGCRTSPPTSTPPPRSPEPVAYSVLSLAWDDRTPFEMGLLASERAVLDRLDDASVYRMDLRIADDLQHVTGTQQVRYTNAETVRVSEVYFHLFPNILGGQLEISNVRVGEYEGTPAYEQDRSVMRLALPAPLEPGDSVQIEMALAITVPTDLTANYGAFALSEGILALAHFYPQVAVYDDTGWNVGTPSPYGDVVYADSSFYLVDVTAPKELTLVASGTSTRRQVSDAKQQITFAAGPARDFYLAASSDYTVYSQKVGAVMINSYAPPELAEGAKVALRVAAEALQVFGKRFGDYPFTELDFVATPTQALGIEYPGIMAMAQRLYPPLSSFSIEYLESTVAHEVAHQWFYSVVGNDQLDEPWLDEALAQYATMLYYRDLYGAQGAQGFRSSLESRWQRVLGAKIPIGQPVSAYTASEYSAIVYGRGPLFVEALAEEMGDQVLESFLRAYYEEFKWGIGTTAGFRALAQEQCQCDLTPLFTEWVYAK